MKTLKYLFTLTTIVLVSLTSCESDEEFLTEKPQSIYTISTAFDKSSQVEALLTTAYRACYDLYGNAGFGGGLRGSLSQGTDMLDVPFWQSAGGTNGRSNFSSYWNSTSGFVNTAWNRFYQIISYANLALYGADLENIVWATPEQQAAAKAQAYFFRGLMYLRLGELWGGVPLVTEFSEELRLDYTRSTAQQTYQQAIDDLLAAYNGLPDYPDEDGRVAKGAAATMLAEAYLAQGVETGDASNYGNAVTYATWTIDHHPLMTSRFGVRANAADGSDNGGIPTYFAAGNVISDLYVPGNYDYYGSSNTEAVWVMQTPTNDQADQYSYTLNSGDSWLYGPALRDVNWAPAYAEAGAAAGPWTGGTYPANHPVYNPWNMGNPAYHGGFGISQIMSPDYLQYPDDWTPDQVGLWDDPTDYRHINDVTWRWSFDCTDPNHSLYGQKVTLDMLLHDNRFSEYAAFSCKVVSMDEWPYRTTDGRIMRYRHDYYAIRSAEAYLLRAEAYIRNGQSGDADINTVRTRAACTNMISGATIQDIIEERGRELCFEEGRWFTFLRMEPSEWQPQVERTAMFIHDYPVFTGSIFFEKWPIPFNVISLNTEADFPQNTGW